MKTIYVILLLFFISAYNLYSDYNPYNDKSKQILIYKLEIEKLQNLLSDNDYYINHYTQKLREYDQKIKFLSDILRDSPKKLGIEINSINDEISIIKQKEKIDKLKDEFKKRILWLYKYGSDYTTELLFTSGSLNEFYARLQYLNKLSQMRKADFDKIKYEEYALIEKRKIRNLSRKDYEIYVRNKKTDQEILLNEKYAIEDSLSNFKFNKEMFQRQIDRFNTSISDLENELTFIEKNSVYKINNNPDYNSNNLNDLKGKLILPVISVDILSDYGKSVNHETGTITFNNGVDVSIAKGSEVFAVADGFVEKIVLIPHYGATVIIKHSDNYRTIYSVLSSISVTQGEYINAGRVIAKTGYNFNGQSFHFEIWDNDVTLDPKQWVRKGSMSFGT